MKGRLPDFLIIGAMKSGTTSLHDYLGKHQDIFTSKVKEIHYFADGLYQKKNIEWYKKHFVTNKLLAGSSPQNYTKAHNKYYQNIPERLKSHIPNAKLIYILRDPIERYKSHILENYYGEPAHDLKYNIESGHYLKTGMYHDQLNAYLPFFNLTQIHIVTLEDLISNKMDTLNKIFDFLNVSNLQDEEVFDFISNDHREKAVPYFYKKSLVNRGLMTLAPNLAKKVNQSKILNKYLFNKDKDNLLNEDKIEELKSIYKKDVDKLRSLTGLKFEKWSI